MGIVAKIIRLKFVDFINQTGIQCIVYNILNIGRILLYLFLFITGTAFVAQVNHCYERLISLFCLFCNVLIVQVYRLSDCN